MKTEKLIKIARNCGSGSCSTKCKYFSRDGSSCRFFLLKDLANKLEIAVSDINKNCGNCMYKSNDYRQLPCSVCEALEFSKWEWQGDAE